MPEAVGHRRSWIVPTAAACLLAAMMAQLALVANANSATWDESNHIYAGFMSLKHGDFGINPEHPPLVKMAAALPLLNMRLAEPPPQNGYFKKAAFLAGRDFVFSNDANRIIFRARIAAALFTVLLCGLVFLATREMFGDWAGLIALALLTFDPNLVAHGSLVTTDVGVSCFLFASVYAFYRYLKAPSLARLMLVGLAAGLALAAKHTGLLIFPMLLGLAICELLRQKNHNVSLGRAARLALSLVIVAVMAVTILWGFYGFRYNARPTGLSLVPTMQEFTAQVPDSAEGRILSAMAEHHLLPESYLYGLADVVMMNANYNTFLLGKIYPHGVWFYFPVAFAIKSTLTFLALLALAIVAIALKKVTCWREILFLGVPAALYLAVAMTSKMNIGVRHILPVYVFMAVLVAGAAWKFIQSDHRWAYLVVALLVFQAISATRTYPAYLAYANEAWGGPSNTYKYLSDSNVDWAQQLKSVNRYLAARKVKDCWFVYFAEGIVDTNYYGVPCKLLPTADAPWMSNKVPPPPSIDGPVLISAGDMSGFEFGADPQLNPYEQFKTTKPTTVIDYAVFVFDGHFQIPLAASIGHAQKTWELLGRQQPQAALAEAQQAVEYGPNTVRANAALGDALSALNRRGEARDAYAKALLLAKTVEPGIPSAAKAMLERRVAAMSVANVGQ